MMGARLTLRGQAIVEAALLAPVLVLLLLLCAGGAALFRAQMVAEAAASEAARYAAQNPAATSSQIEAAALAAAGDEGDAAVTVSYDNLAPEPYTMRVVDADGAERAAEALNLRRSVTVEVSIGYTVPGTGTVLSATSRHSTVTSTEGVPG